MVRISILMLALSLLSGCLSARDEIIWLEAKRLFSAEPGDSISKEKAGAKGEFPSKAKKD